MAFGITELNVRYSNLIKDYLNKGYVISPFTIGDGFGFSSVNYFFQKGLTFFDLINPKEKNVIYRVWLKPAYSKDLELLKIEVRKYNRKVFCGTLRPDEGDIVNEKSFFVVSGTEKRAYTDSEDEITRINKCRSDRRALQESLERSFFKNGRYLEVDKLPADFIDSIMVRINRVRGFKRANATCIKTVTLYKESPVTLYKGSRYDWRRDKQVNKLKAHVFFSYNGKAGHIYLD